MSRPDPKPTALDLADLLGYKLSAAEHQRAAAELDAARARLALCELRLAQTAGQLEHTRSAIAQAYELGEGDGFDRASGAILRAPEDPREPTAPSAPKKSKSNGASATPAEV